MDEHDHPYQAITCCMKPLSLCFTFGLYSVVFIERLDCRVAIITTMRGTASLAGTTINSGVFYLAVVHLANACVMTMWRRGSDSCKT